MNELIETLVSYAITHHLMYESDAIYARNRILALLKIETFIPNGILVPFTYVDELLAPLCKYAIEANIIEDTQRSKDAFDSAIMDCLCKRPSQLIKELLELKESDVQKCSDTFYAFCEDSNYIRKERIAKNINYQRFTKYGVFDITINCSKPEKDPRDIAKQKTIQSSTYPTCVLCKENEGYYGHDACDGRSNIRLLPIKLAREDWYFQYSPYVYYNEHCIVLSGRHTPMKTEQKTFARLLSFVEQFPHYFLGSNADLPIVGGSILSHDHYQGGNYTFAMENASIVKTYPCFETQGVCAAKLYWPLSVLRLSSTNKIALEEACELVRKTWSTYSDATNDIMAYTTQPHNTLSCIARKKKDNYEIDLVLRNNRQSEEYPLGIFHPHDNIHHIKKENIGIIEVNGLAVLPARLKEEIKWMEAYLLNNDTTHDLQEHQNWLNTLQIKYNFTQENIQTILYQEIANVFVEGLEHCGVFKLDEKGSQGFDRFIQAVVKYKEEKA
ncbi:MAG: UDP-glucose--hexose-1-phosphate uridylyltransferase [Longicatena sp.]